MASRDADHTSSFLRDGYCICRGFLSPSDLAVLRRESDALLARAASAASSASASASASASCTAASWDVLQDGCVLDLFSERQVPIDARREPGPYLKARQQRSRDARARGGGASEDKSKEAEEGDEAEKKEVAVAGIIAGIVGRALPSRAYGLLRAWREQQGGIEGEDGDEDDDGGSGGGRAAAAAVAESGLGWTGETKGGNGAGGNGAGGNGTGTAGGTLVTRGNKRRRTDCSGSADSSETGSSEAGSQHPPQSQQQGATGEEGIESGGRGSVGKGKVVYLFNEHHVVKPARSKVAFRWHTDEAEQLAMCVDPPCRDYLSAWCALDDASPESGGLWVDCVDHAGGGEGGCDGEGCNGSEEDGDGSPRTEGEGGRDERGGSGGGRALVATAGDVVFFKSNLWHRSGSNGSAATRRAFYAQYSLDPIRDSPKAALPLLLAVPFAISDDAPP